MVHVKQIFPTLTLGFAAISFLLANRIFCGLIAVFICTRSNVSAEKLSLLLKMQGHQRSQCKLEVYSLDLMKKEMALKHKTQKYSHIEY